MVLPAAVTPTRSVHTTPSGIVVVVEDIDEVVELIDVVEVVDDVVGGRGKVVVVVEVVGEVVVDVGMLVVVLVVVVVGPVLMNFASAMVPPLV